MSSSTNDAQNLRGNRCQKVKSSNSPVTDTKFRHQLSIDVPRSSKAYDSDDSLEKTSRSSRKTCVQCESAEVPIVPEHRQDTTKSNEHDEKRRTARVDGDIQDWGREFSSRMISGLVLKSPPVLRRKKFDVLRSRPRPLSVEHIAEATQLGPFSSSIRIFTNACTVCAKS